jgi:23S rRNA pseudouridine2605 synthase
MPESMRIQRALARAGVASRRGAEELVAAGRVQINGAVAETGQSVDPARDTITVDGKKIAAPPALRWIVLNKPTGVLTTRDDPSGRRTVFELVDDVPGLTYVGRLDYMTEGVLLLTTDGDAAHKLTHPSNEIERTYIATVRGDGADAARAAMRGVELEDGLVVPRNVIARRVARGMWELELTIAEGRKHEVRRLCEALGLRVERLVRTKFGPVKLGSLETGKTRALTAREAEIIAALTKGGEGRRTESPAPGRGGERNERNKSALTTGGDRSKTTKRGPPRDRKRRYSR